jgi:hypothetical protein
MSTFTSPLPILDEIDRAHAQLSPEAQKAIQLSGIVPKAAANLQAQTPLPTGPAAPVPLTAPRSTPVAGIPIPTPPTPSSGRIIPIPLRPVGTAPVSATPIPIQSPALQGSRNEVARLTVPTVDPATGQPFTNRSQRQDLAGIDKLPNAARIPLKVLSGIGSTFLPGITANIPGTELHHQMVVNRAENAEKQQETQLSDDQRRALEAAQASEAESAIPLKGAQASEAEARAEELRNPKPKDAFSLWVAHNPNGTPEEWAQFQESHRPTSTEFEAWAKQNPGKTVADWLKLKEETTSEGKALNPFQEWRKANPKAPVDDWLKLEESVKPGARGEYEDFKAAYKKNHPVADDESVVKAYAAEHKPPPNPQQPPQALIVNPTTHQFEVARPGSAVPEGFMTETGAANANAPTTQMRNVSAQASLVHEQTPAMLSEIDRLKDKLGPMAGRWNDFMQGKVGTADPDFAGLRADLLMYSSAVALMHARGRLPENLREEFDRAINNPKQDFSNLKATISRIDDWTSKNMEAMSGKKSTAAATHNAPQAQGGYIIGQKYQGQEYLGGDPKVQGSWK